MHIYIYIYAYIYIYYIYIYYIYIYIYAYFGSISSLIHKSNTGIPTDPEENMKA